jgi:hypothetical protein
MDLFDSTEKSERIDAEETIMKGIIVIKKMVKKPREGISQESLKKYLIESHFLVILPEVGEWKNERKANEADELNNDANEQRQSRRKEHLDDLKAIF